MQILGFRTMDCVFLLMCFFLVVVSVFLLGFCGFNLKQQFGNDEGKYFEGGVFC